MDQSQLTLDALDYIVFFAYFVLVIGFALWVSFKPRGHERNSTDFFLAGRALPWWIIGTSLIASNISAEQVVGMTGSVYAGGIAIVSYEWMAAVTLLIVARFFLPTFLKMQIFSMPQYLERRFDYRVSMGLGVFWLLVYVFVNLTSVSYLGALTLNTITGLPLIVGIVSLLSVSAIYTLTGGLMAVAWTDFIQVTILFIGGGALTYFGLTDLGEGAGIWTGFQNLMHQVPDHFHTVMAWNHDKYPWIGIFIGGLWAANLSYWGFNQYITQRALAGRDLQQAQLGMAFAAFLKVIVPFVVVIPGVIAVAMFGAGIDPPDKAYPTLIRDMVPVGFKGLIIAALIAAIVSSLNSMTNSTATIFTMDIYRKINKKASEKQLVFIGRAVSGIVLVIAAIFAPMLSSLKEVFQYIQEYTGMVSPGVVAIFIYGVFWPRCTSAAALSMAVFTIPISAFFKFMPGWFAPESFISQFMSPFLNQMGVVTLVLFALGYVVTLMTSKPGEVAAGAAESKADVTTTSAIFNVSAIGICGVLMTLYIYFW